uniref:Uncharacterized protein n=1 Tax=Arundo donax TaxID=35708 RepID=A0A0A9FW41_ARUDO
MLTDIEWSTLWLLSSLMYHPADTTYSTVTLYLFVRRN